jgi:hypothetical protein
MWKHALVVADEHDGASAAIAVAAALCRSGLRRVTLAARDGGAARERTAARLAAAGAALDLAGAPSRRARGIAREARARGADLVLKDPTPPRLAGLFGSPDVALVRRPPCDVWICGSELPRRALALVELEEHGFTPGDLRVLAAARHAARALRADLRVRVADGEPHPAAPALAARDGHDLVVAAVPRCSPPWLGALVATAADRVLHEGCAVLAIPTCDATEADFRAGSLERGERPTQDGDGGRADAAP